jgi:predicted PurR-regulated permease PerM
VQNAPKAIADIAASEWFASLEARVGVDLSAMIKDAWDSATRISSFLAITGGLLHAGAGIIGFISNSIIVVVLTLYFLAAMPAMKTALSTLVAAYRRERFAAMVDQITFAVGKGVAGAVILSAINAAVVFLIEILIGSPVAALMAIVAFFITLVPMIGSVVFWIIGTIAALFLGPWAAVVFAVLYLGYIQLEAYVLTPRIIGRVVEVPGVLVLVAAMVGAAVMGLLGALIAIPVTASILIIIRQVFVPMQDSKIESPFEIP